MVYIYRTFESVPAATATCIHRQTSSRCPGKKQDNPKYIPRELFGNKP